MNIDWMSLFISVEDSSGAIPNVRYADLPDVSDSTGLLVR